MNATAKPVRIQRSRAKGARLVSPNGLPIVCCTRPGKWGNPFRVGGHFKIGQPRADGGICWIWLQCFEPAEGFHTIRDAAESVEWYRRYALAWKVKEIREELRGKNIACWCALDKPCHGSVLLEIANAPSPAPAETGGQRA